MRRSLDSLLTLFTTSCTGLASTSTDFSVCKYEHYRATATTYLDLRRHQLTRENRQKRQARLPPSSKLHPTLSSLGLHRRYLYILYLYHPLYLIILPLDVYQSTQAPERPVRDLTHPWFPPAIALPHTLTLFFRSLLDSSTSFAANSAQGSAKKAAAAPKKARPRRSSSHNHGKAPLSAEDDGYAMGSYDNEPIEEGSATPSWVMNTATESKSPSSPLTSAPQSPNAPQEMIAPIPFHLHTLSGVPSAMPPSTFAPLHSSNGHSSHMTPTMPPLGHFPPTMAYPQGPAMPAFGQLPPASAPPSLAPGQQHSDAIARILALQQANSLPLNASNSSSSSGGHMLNSSNGYAQPPNFVPIGFDMPRTMSPGTGTNVSTPPMPFFSPSGPNMPLHNPFMHVPPPHVSSPSLSAPPAFGAAPIFPPPTSMGVPNKNGYIMQTPPPVFTVPSQSPTIPVYHDASAAAQRHLKTSNKTVPSPRNNIHAHHNFGVPAQP